MLASSEIQPSQHGGLPLLRCYAWLMPLAVSHAVHYSRSSLNSFPSSSPHYRHWNFPAACGRTRKTHKLPHTRMRLTRRSTHKKKTWHCYSFKIRNPSSLSEFRHRRCHLLLSLSGFTRSQAASAARKKNIFVGRNFSHIVLLSVVDEHKSA